MNSIRSMSNTKAYRDNWDKIFKTQSYWYKFILCAVCSDVISRIRQYSIKPIDDSKRYVRTNELCSLCWHQHME